MEPRRRPRSGQPRGRRPDVEADRLSDLDPDYLVPPLTTVRMPLAALGAAGVDALVAQITGGLIRDMVVATAPPLVVRGSTGPRPVPARAVGLPASLGTDPVIDYPRRLPGSS